MNNDSFRSSLARVSRALREMKAALDAIPAEKMKYLYNLEMNKDLYPFHLDLATLSQNFDTYKRKVYDNLDKLELSNSLTVDSSIVLAGLGYDFEKNVYGDELNLSDDMWKVNIVNPYGNKSAFCNTNFTTSTEVEYGTLVYKVIHYVQRPNYFEEVARYIKEDRIAFQELFTANRTVLIQKLCAKYNVRFEAITGSDSGYIPYRKFTDLRVYDEASGFDKTYDTVNGRYEDTLKKIINDIEEHREQHYTA